MHSPQRPESQCHTLRSGMLCLGCYLTLGVLHTLNDQRLLTAGMSTVATASHRCLSQLSSTP